MENRRLLVSSVVEARDEIEERYERAYNYLQTLTNGLSEKEAHDALNNAVCKEKSHEDVSLGLLTSILTDPPNAAKCYRDLTLITRDGLASVLAHLNNLIVEKYMKFQDTARNQLIWLVRELIRNAVTGADNICWNLMRYAAGGDQSPRNIFLVESLLDTYVEHRAWLEKFPTLVCAVIYSYLRLIEDHFAPHLLPLRQREVTFVVSLIRERFADCITIGRDFLRLLQNVAVIPEFNALWQDILQNPKSLCPAFTNILQIMQIRTSRRFLQSRLTPEMERKVYFLTSHVRFGHHKRYQEWFQRQYLATPESHSLRSDMIRFIVGVIHPSNEVLCSDIIPRWAVIGWLLTTCTSNTAASTAKLALFYDWLYYDPEKDNIMNIEPAILVMHHSMRPHPAVTASLLDFLCRIIPNFYPPHAEKVRQGIYNALRHIIEKRVLPNLYPLFDSPKLDKELRATVHEMFKEFCISNDAAGPNRNEDLNILEVKMPNDEPAFSDDEEEALVVVNKPEPEDTDDDDLPLSEMKATPRDRSSEEIIASLPPSLKASAERLLDEKTTAGKGAAMSSILTGAVDSSASINNLSELFLLVLQDCPLPRLSRHPSPKELEEAIQGPLFSMFQCLLSNNTPETSKKRKIVLETFKEIHLQNSFHSVGYSLLMYLKVLNQREKRAEKDAVKRRIMRFKTSVYTDYCNFLDLKIEDALADDLSVCSDVDVNMLTWLTPDLFKEFKDTLQNHVRVLHTIVNSIDSSQVQELICLTLQGTLMMFKSDNIMALLLASLSWESIEQYYFWQLLAAHDLSVEDVLPILPKMDFKKHSEALTSVMLMLKQEKPTVEVVRQLFSREPEMDGDMFVVSTLMYWCQDYEDKLGDLVGGLLSTRYPGTSPNKRKRPTKNASPNTPPTAEQILGHLEQMRVCCLEEDDMSFYKLESIQKALQSAQSNSTDNIRKQFADLFALAWEEELPVSRRARKVASSAITTRVRNSSNEDSEDEEIVKRKQAKRRKKAISDSD